MDDTPTCLCWLPTWNARHPRIGLEHAVVHAGAAQSSLLAIDDDGEPLRLSYALQWDRRTHRLTRATLEAHRAAQVMRRDFRVGADGGWADGDGPLPQLDGCLDIDIWPTPLTNSFPLWRAPLRIGERREVRVAWVAAPALDVVAKAQAYTRIAERVYRFQSLDGSAFEADLTFDEAGFVLDYPGLFERVHLERRPGADAGKRA